MCLYVREHSMSKCCQERDKPCYLTTACLWCCNMDLLSWFRWFLTGLREIEFWDVLELSLKPSISVTVWCIVLILSPPKCVLVAGEVCLKIEFKRDNSFRPIQVDMYVAINRIIWKNLNTLYVLHFYVYLLTFYVFTFRIYLSLKILSFIFMPPRSKIGGHIVFVLSVILSFCHSVIL